MPNVEVIPVRTMRVGERYITVGGITIGITKVDPSNIHYEILTTHEGKDIEPALRKSSTLVITHQLKAQRLQPSTTQTTKVEEAAPVTVMGRKKGNSKRSLITDMLHKGLDNEAILKKVKSAYPDAEEKKVSNQIANLRCTLGLTS